VRRRLIFAALFCACSTSAASPPDKIEPGYVKGRVVDAAGAPLAGVKMVVEHTVLHATYVYARTGDDGRYRVEVPAGSWNVTAQIEREYHGRRHKLDLHPAIAEPFAGSAGAVRDFSLRVSGARPQGGFYGGTLTLYRDFFDPGLELEHVEIAMTPDGPLVDGSEGKALAMKPASGGDQIQDVPIGRYRFSARRVAPGETPAPLLLRVRNRGDFAAEVTAILVPPYPEATGHALELEIRAKTPR